MSQEHALPNGEFDALRDELVSIVSRRFWRQDTAEDAARIEEVVALTAARQLLVELTFETATLAQFAARQTAQTTGEVISQDAHDAPSLQSDIASSRGRHWTSPNYLLAASALAISIWAGLAVWVFPRWRSGQNEPNHAAVKLPAAETAIFVGGVNCRWSDGSHPLPGKVLSGSLRLEAGVAQLRLQNGTQIIVEGPTDFEVGEFNRVQLRKGRLTAKIPAQAVGFTVVTPSAEVIDLGTEFGVLVNDDRETEVQVYVGKISVCPRSTDMIETVPQILSAGESTKIVAGDRPNEFVLREVTGTPTRLSRKLPEENTTPRQQFPNALVAYWSFDEHNREGIAWDVRGNNHGTLVGVERAPGLVGRGAVRFDNAKGQVVRLPAQSLGLVFAQGITIEVLFTSQWSGKAFDYDELFRKDGLVTFSFQNDNNDQIDGPVLALEIAGCVSLDMPLDGREGRPSLAEITDGKPHHAVATGDGTTGQFAIFIDGVERFSQIVKPKLSFNGGSEATPLIGNYSGNLQEPFNGIIDEVAIYAGPLTAGEIAAHWAMARNGNSYFTSPAAANK